MLDWMATKQLSLGKPNQPSIHIILPDKITERNLIYTALRKGINTNLFQMQRLETMASIVLQSSTNEAFSYLDSKVLESLILRVVAENKDSELGFLRRLKLTNEDTLEVLRREFFEYLRGTNDGELNQELLVIAQSQKDEFARSSSVACLKAFYCLKNKLDELVKREFGDSVLTTRNRLIRLATETIENSASKVSMEGVEIAVVGIWVLDAVALRFLTALGSKTSCTVRLFCANRIYNNLKSRLDEAGAPYKCARAGAYPDYKLCPHAARIIGRTGTIAEPELLALPDRRREMIAVAERISKLLRDGTRPMDIVIMTRDSGLYLSLANDILPAFGIPFHVQTRLPSALLSQCQMVASILELLTDASIDSEIDWSDLTDPVRLGICLAGKPGWPMQSSLFVYLEEELASIQSKEGRPQGLRLSEWVTKVTGTMMWSLPKNMLLTYLEWVGKKCVQPESIQEALMLIGKLLGTYMYNQSVWIRETEDPRIWEPGRFRLDEMHPTYYARQIRAKLGKLETYIDSIKAVTGAPALSWKVILDAYEEVIFGSSYRLPLQDLGAVRIADVGTSWFVEAEHLFLLGMRSEGFPRKCPEGRLLSQSLRSSVAEPTKGKSAFLFLIGPSSDYDRESDFFQLSLMTASKTVTCMMPYLDESGHAKEWSPFLDTVSVGAKEIEPSVWLPSPEKTDWAKLACENPPWIRWRLYAFHQHRRVLASESDAIDKKGLLELAKSIQKEKYEQHLQPRIDRYIEPPTSIEVDGSEACFSTLSLDKIAGPPFRTTELDLHAVCPFQFYFHQFLFRIDSKGIERDDVPYYSKKPHWKYGMVPKRISYFYLSSEIGKAISSLLTVSGDRQSIVSKFASSQDFSRFIRSQVDTYNDKRLQAPMSDEYNLVGQEIRDRIKRNWQWIPGGQITRIQNKHGESSEIILPSHRVDSLTHGELIIVYVNFPTQIQKLYEGSPGSSEDSRLTSLMLHYSKDRTIAGGIYVGLYDSVRKGFYQARFIPYHKGRRGYDCELPMPLPDNRDSQKQVFNDARWNGLLDEFRESIVERAKQMTPTGKVVYTADPQLEVCEKCVYNTLCQIPRSLGW